ncbi:hypothetical protein TOPH_03316 [Tolypocladium ophioglossoides CBS 100239]|uniref:DUF676 domain-containing protein n=1 Tax=Tolypocladium ophioglossoides (strain CBS 100239) TaxID=1163406 RepID=A0A0L0ND74_TOLOC|nr:hypothetical protein TOPH_03316 [Tolypocladium ophioglossoides CBS 100239]
MAAGDDGALRSPVLAAAEPANDGDSLHVNPGSPRSPPPLNREHDGRPPQPPSPPSHSSRTDETNPKADVSHDEASNERAALTRFTIDPAGDLTFDETTVDVVTVPCPGGHPLRSWNRDGLMSRYFGAPSMRDAEVKDEIERPSPSWVRQGIRREADRARILLYEHPEAVEGTTLSRLADALLEELQALRAAEGQERPLVFIGHSIGGLVVKMALTKASRAAKYDNIMRECYGVAFFGTPHQGSGYFAMPSLAPSIQSLLQLSSPLPASITDDLRVGNSLLLHVDEDFKSVSSDVRVWTFYETIDSRLSAGSSGGPAAPEWRDVYFTAPLASIKSAILGMRLEMIFPMQSDHANVASFGRNNVHTLRMFLKQLAAQIKRADMSLRDADGDGHWTLGLGQKVNIEVHGFFDDPPIGGDPEEASIIRAWSTRLPLKEFLNKGPEECLSERLNEVEGAPEETRFLRARGRTSLIERDIYSERDGSGFAAPAPLTIKNALGIQDRQAAAAQQMVTPGSPIIRPVDYPHDRTRSAPATAPRGLTTPPPRAISPPTRPSSPLMRSSALIRANFDQDLAIDRLSPPLRPRVGRSISRSFSLGSDRSRIEYRDFPPFSQRSRSTFNEAALGSDVEADDIDASPRLPEAVVALPGGAREGQQRTSGTAAADEAPVAFVKPDVRARRFVWVHVPFNNPTWVKNVLQTLEVCYKRDLSMLYSHDFWAARHTRGRHAQHYAYFAKPGCYFTAPRTMSPRHSLTSPAMSPASVDEAMYTCLFLPYLHFDSYKRLIRRRDLILKRLSHGRARPVPESVAKSDSLELQVVWEFLGHDPPINCRRTLDQYGYPSLRDTRSRDDDQMLYKLTKERGCCMVEQERDMYGHGSSTGAGSQKDGRVSSSASLGWRERLMGRGGGDDPDDDMPEEEMVLNGNVLMVDQLWIWVINSRGFNLENALVTETNAETDTVLSFFPKRESDPIEGPLYQQADLRDSIFNEVNVDLTGQCENALDLAALAALHAVSVLLDRSSHPDLEVFRIFEEAISVLTEKLTSSLKEFRTVGFRDKAFDYEPMENGVRSLRARHKEEGLRAEQENRDNTSAVLELRDVEDELLTLVHLFERQSKVIASMNAIYARPELRDLTASGRVFLSEALKRLREYAHQADEMIRRVRATRDDYDKLLQMVQRQAQVDERHDLHDLHRHLPAADLLHGAFWHEHARMGRREQPGAADDWHDCAAVELPARGVVAGHRLQHRRAPVPALAGARIRPHDEMGVRDAVEAGARAGVARVSATGRAEGRGGEGGGAAAEHVGQGGERLLGAAPAGAGEGVSHPRGEPEEGVCCGCVWRERERERDVWGEDEGPGDEDEEGQVMVVMLLCCCFCIAVVLRRGGVSGLHCLLFAA